MEFLLLVFSVTLFARSESAYMAMRYEHDYVKDGRTNDGPFPTFGNQPYYCYQVPSKGPCGMVRMVWFFDVVTRRCQRMIYSGCGGNENRFESQAECNHHCGRKRGI
ncbi:kunitz/Bovine pancreatic trypsin inhibitor domain-containing protein [Phthorimaea operculella]|nr:kunitz/Bovine pancreatic trypsin inhibitor domain-containing protein [Phthorimaea operculella]